MVVCLGTVCVTAAGGTVPLAIPITACGENMIRPHPPNNHAYLIHTLLYANHHSTPKHFTILAQCLHEDSKHQHNDTEYAQDNAINFL